MIKATLFLLTMLAVLEPGWAVGTTDPLECTLTVNCRIQLTGALNQNKNSDDVIVLADTAHVAIMTPSGMTDNGEQGTFGPPSSFYNAGFYDFFSDTISAGFLSADGTFIEATVHQVILLDGTWYPVGTIFDFDVLSLSVVRVCDHK